MENVRCILSPALSDLERLLLYPVIRESVTPSAAAER